MAYTAFGEFMRIKRIKNREVMGDTAKLFGVKVPFISAVENGKRNVPEEWFSILVEHYNLSELEKHELLHAIALSKTQVKVDLVDATELQRKVAVQFQRSFANINDQKAKEIIKILGE